MKSNLFTVISMLLGILSIITCPFFFISVPAAGLSIIFAVISKGGQLKMEIMSRAGVITSSVGMVLSGAITALLVSLMLFSPAYRKQLNDTSQAIYGQTFDEIMKDSYGYSLEDVVKSLGGVY